MVSATVGALKEPVAAVAALAISLLLGLSGTAGADDRRQILRQILGPDHNIIAIGFDHIRGQAFRAVIDQRTGKTLQEQIYPGRPQSSRWEFHDAVCILGSDAALGRLVAEGAIAEGGFIVDGPAGHPASHRYIQIRLLSPDRQSLLRVALVDLTERIVASARSSFE